ncbi:MULTISPECIES: cytochrome c oxidase subunit II [Bacillales]|uniref:Cytochrome aa3 subunit 2 n=1 Tax=Lysinibacillus louembei TaxID=1470088 RepID=A0ABZ0RT72_9BACI|nr:MULTISPECIES: cytochrome c oxidase subunit II [Bacillales]MCT6922682.1 cytochrome c oxidase subunit II [Metasolibacillus sp.]MCT6938979.1 cytochrome c oxidase subunit II [Metasolibacillus sp.]WPK11424.1 cytochrome c oxidase subunit II [Lysinibacillus louembei]
MHLHKYEKWWLVFGTGTLVAFLVILGIGAFHSGSHPNDTKWTIDYERVEDFEPFNNPGVHKVEGKDWDYEVVLIASAFNYNPMEIELPLNAKVRFIATTKDVIHGFHITGTNVNMMLEPGYVSEYTTVVNKTGEYLIVCNEYCGTGHAFMYSTLKVVDPNATNDSE